MRNLRIRYIGLMILAFIALAGCGGTDSFVTQSVTPGPQPGWRSVNPVAAMGRKKWTMLVYMNAANNLEPYSGLNINQMEQVGSTDQVNIVVQIKKISNKYDPSFTDWKDSASRRFLIQKDSDPIRVGSPLLAQKDDADAGKAETLKEFIRWGVATFPAERYCLIIWNHGAGWRSQKVAGATRGVSYDDVTGSNINTIELPDALSHPEGRKWDLLAWDSSLMQMLEVAYEVRDKADYIVGSEESPPGEGYPYHLFLTRLAANPTMPPRELGEWMARDTLENYTSASDITQSVIDPTKLEALVSAVNQLGGALNGASNVRAEITEARNLPEVYAYPQNSDLLDFVRVLTEVPSGGSVPRVPDAAVQTAAHQVEAAAREAILFSVNGSRHPRSNGLSIYLPSARTYRTDDIAQANGFGQRYSQLAFSQVAPQWLEFLQN